MAVCLAGGWAAGVAGDDVPAAAEPIHSSPAAVEEAVLSATRAFLHSDAAAARKALDIIEAGCRRLNPEEAETLGSETVGYDRAFHETLSRARELATRGDVDRAFDQFVWVQRGCRVCHGFDRSAQEPENAPGEAGTK